MAHTRERLAMAVQHLLPSARAQKENSSSASSYIINEKPIGTTHELRVATIGAGASGLNLARHMELHMENFQHVVYEKNEEVGGTWFENRYPGCACDIPSHSYQFTWEPNPNWSKFYSSAPEIGRYFKDLTEKYELYKYVKLRHEVSGAVWNEDEGKWFLKVKDHSTGRVFDDWCHVLINGSGILNNWKWPEIPGLHSFGGELIHSATWHKDYDLKGKTVAVLGCGSSGVQIVPAILPHVKSLTTFIRTPTWITAGFAQNKAGPNGANFEYSEELKQRFRDNPQDYMAYRKDIESELNTRFKFVVSDSPEQEEARRFSAHEMRTKLGNDERLLKHLIPDFAVGCRRTTPGNGYLEALTAPNVEVITEAIEKIVPEGIQLSSGRVVKVDVFICATGFDISFCPRFPLAGRNGIELADQWKDKPEAYLSIGAENFPNYFMFLGPSAPISQGSVLPIIEHLTRYMINMMKKMQTQNVKSVVPYGAAIRDFNEHTTKFMQRTAWATGCRSWFKNGKVNGPVVALHPGSRNHWFHMTSQIRFEDWEFKYRTGNRFAYLGNGFSTWEEPGKDSTWYFDDPEAGYLPY